MFALTAMATTAFAEGAVQVLDCTQTTTCDAAGACGPDDAAIVFTLTPVDVGPGGAGEYTIAHGGAAYPMTNTGTIGPFVWAEGADDVQTLMPTGPNTLLWVRQNSATALTATTHFLTCKDPA
ncbi:MAG: hypothetical protein KKB02_05945 [Alphaproteobacteria bacterium]|nr:hypothetical protein [Alphaproteobacteria bacterium]